MASNRRNKGLQGASILTGILGTITVGGVPFTWPVVTAVLGNSYFFVISTTLLSLFLTGICLIYKYAPLILNDMRNYTNNDLKDLGLILWLIFILLIPLFFNVGPMWLVLWWLLLLWSYMIPAEKRLAFFFVFLILMSNWIAHLGAGFLTYTETQLNRQIYAIEHKISDADDIAAVASWITAHPSDAEPTNTMALVEINRSNFSEAIRYLNRGIDLEPNNARFYNHLGIALLGSGKNKEALRSFQNAISLMPENMVYYYNVSRLYQSTYNFYEGEKAIAAASGFDSDGVRRLLDQENMVGRTRYIQEYTPLMQLLARQMRPSDDLKTAANALWTFAFGLIPRSVSIYLAIGSFLAFIMLGYIPSDKFTKRCSRCGKLYYSGSMTKTGSPMCLQCHWIDIKVKKQQVSIVHQKTEEIRKYKTFSYQKLLRLELILPGLGSFLTNRTGRGLARITLFCACLLAVITGGSFIISFLPVQMEYTGIIRVIGIATYGLLLLRAYKSPPIRFGV
jgi:tetratricopeptide (TPR) repeat protein